MQMRVDASSVLVLEGIAFSLLAMLAGGSVRFPQLRENAVSSLIGLGAPLPIYEKMLH